MSLNPDFKDLLSLLAHEEVEYLIVGAHAVVFYAEPRFTKDLDIWVNPTAENARRVCRALKAFGAPEGHFNEADFCNPEIVCQIGVPPNRIDILMSIAGVDFASAWADRQNSTYGGVPICILGKEHLIASKRAAGRPQDLLDVERLERD